MLQEHPLVKRVEQGTVKDEKYLFLGLEIWEKALKESGWRSVFSAYSFWQLCSLRTYAWEKKSLSELSSLGMPKIRYFGGFKDNSPPCCSWKCGGSRVRQLQLQAPISNSGLQSGRAAAWFGQGWVEQRKLDAPVKGAFRIFCSPSVKRLSDRHQQPVHLGLGHAFSSTPDFQVSSHPSAQQPALGTILWAAFRGVKEYTSSPEVNVPKALLLPCPFHWKGGELL